MRRGREGRQREMEGGLDDVAWNVRRGLQCDLGRVCRCLLFVSVHLPPLLPLAMVVLTKYTMAVVRWTRYRSLGGSDETGTGLRQLLLRPRGSIFRGSKGMFQLFYLGTCPSVAFHSPHRFASHSLDAEHPQDC